MPGRLAPLTIKANKSDTPFFAKLRVEVTPELFRGAQAKVVFTAYLDPIYNVHWNNRAGKVTLKILSSEDSYAFSKREFQSIDVEADADVDPRWMLGKMQSLDEKPLEVEMTYTVCDDKETFCKEVTQTYVITCKRDRNGGTRPGIFLNEMFAGVKKFDRNGDKVITKDELPRGRVTLFVGHLDYNIDGEISFDEVDQFMTMFNNGKGVDKKNDGG